MGDSEVLSFSIAMSVPKEEILDPLIEAPLESDTDIVSLKNDGRKGTSAVIGIILVCAIIGLVKLLRQDSTKRKF